MSVAVSTPGSLPSPRRQQQLQQQSQYQGCKVTVFGFPLELAQRVVERLTPNDDALVDYQVSGNWVHVEYSQPFYAQVALSRNGELLVDNYIIGVCAYRDKLDQMMMQRNTPGSIKSIAAASPVKFK